MKSASRAFQLIMSLLVVATACSDLPTEQINTSLVGVWQLVGYRDGDQAPTPSGTWVFFDDGFMALDLQFDYDDRPDGVFAATGHFQQTASAVTLEVRRFVTNWTLEFTDTEATFRQTGPTPADGWMVLRRF